ncbi:MAG: non-ribosomal peptide synthetase [Candidatus Parabeggiatoa sp. nov. 1]|nr:MAG: non-ribosomal peptide synthetase [Gammaproteobacteria bacterium]
MKSIEMLFFQMNNLQIKLWEEEGDLCYSAPKGTMTSALRTELAKRKAEILAFLTQNQVKLSGELPPIQPVPRDKDLPLSFAQQRLWFLAQLEDQGSPYNMSGAINIQGPLNIGGLEQSLTELVQRHEVLRTTFPTNKGVPFQAIAPSQSAAIPVINLHSLPKAWKEVQWLAIAENQRTFDLVKGPLLRMTLLKLPYVETAQGVLVPNYVLLWTIHHIVFDGWSTGVFIRELSTLYEALSQGQPSPLPALPIQYADFTLWQRQWLSGEVLDKQLSYWRQQLADVPWVLDMPTDHPRPPVHTSRGGYEILEVNPQLTQQLKTLSQQAGVTLFMTTLAAFAILVSRYSGQENMVIGSPIANRHSKELEPLIGFFVNTLALRIDLSGNPLFLDLLGRVRQVTLEAYSHQYLPFEQLVEALQPDRDMSRNPLVQIMFAFQNAPISPLDIQGLTFSPMAFETGTVRFDLEFHIWETSGGLKGQFFYYKDLFEAITIKRLLGHFQTLLAAIATNPNQSIFDYSLLTKAERHQLLVEWNHTTTDYAKDQCLHQLFEAQVAQTPEAIALIFESSQLTYQELNIKANQLAHYLHALGVKPEVLVGLCVERSIEMVIGLLGILKAGGAYVPLDPSYPLARLTFILEDSQVLLLLTQEKLKDQWSGLKAQMIYLDTDWELISRFPQENRVSGVFSENLAYVIYTSGSTGKPKGVQISHQSVTNFLNSMRYSLELTHQDTLLAITTISFDIAVLELYLPLMVGAKVMLASREIASDGVQLLEKLKHSDSTVMQATPATWHMLSAAGWKASPHLKILVGGETLSQNLAHQLQKKGDQVWNLYGPTETTIWSSTYPFNKVSLDTLRCDTPVYIGSPIANTQIYILDHYFHLAPIGVIGELHIGGMGLARGYLNRPVLTGEKFIPNPFSNDSNARFYKTGDLARYLPDGNIEYLGRLDNQVKIRGFRIELGEIEAVLAQHPLIRETVVICAEAQPNDKRLIAYVVHERDAPTLSRDISLQKSNVEQPSSWEDLVPQLRHRLQEQLPEYMVPSAFVRLEAIPLTPNGKIDRHALPSPKTALKVPEANYVAPSTPTEKMLASIWTEVLGIEKVGIHDNFFEFGGHSLLATQLVSRIHETFSVKLPLRDLFESPTVAKLTERIEVACHDNGAQLLAPPIKPIEQLGDIPLSFAQERLWFLYQLTPDNPFYNIPFAVRLIGSLNIAALKQSLFKIVQRHEVLRTTFSMKNGVPIQVIHPFSTERLRFLVVDLQALSHEEQAFEVQRLTTLEAQRPFNLICEPSLRVTLLQQHTEEYVLLVSTHRLTIDVWSRGILVRELSALYDAFSMGQPSPFPELPIQYADFVHWQRHWFGTVLETQLRYWQQRLADAPPMLEIPTDHPRPLRQTFRGGMESFELSSDLTKQLNTLSQQAGVTLFMTTLAAFAILLKRYSDQEDIVIGSPIANRNHKEIEPLIGFFVNLLALRIDLSGNPTFLELLKQIQQVTLEAYAHQNFPFEQLVEILQPERDMTINPLFQITFAFQNAPMPPLELKGLTTTFCPVLFEAARIMRFYLEFNFWEREGKLIGRMFYYKDLFEATTIVRLLEHFQTLLVSIAENPEQPISEA